MDLKLEKRGMLICFEGLDHCGKSTQVKMLQKYFKDQNTEVQVIQFPGFFYSIFHAIIIERTTEIGILINQYLTNSKQLDNTVIHMLFSINRWEFQFLFFSIQYRNRKHIEKQLNSGITIIMDRYAYSGVAFTAAKGYDLEWCKNADRGLPEPDIIIFLEINEEEIVKRGDFGREVYEKQDFQKKVKEMYEKLIENNPKFVKINGNDSIEQIYKQIIKLIQELDKKINGYQQIQPISKLWTK